MVNTALIDLYWRVGEYISRKVESSAWGEGVVDQLAEYINQEHPELKGFTRRNLFRMRQFFETYRNTIVNILKLKTERAESFERLNYVTGKSIIVIQPEVE